MPWFCDNCGNKLGNTKKDLENTKACPECGSTQAKRRSESGNKSSSDEIVSEITINLNSLSISFFYIAVILLIIALLYPTPDITECIEETDSMSSNYVNEIQVCYEKLETGLFVLKLLNGLAFIFSYN